MMYDAINGAKMPSQGKYTSSNLVGSAIKSMSYTRSPKQKTGSGKFRVNLAPFIAGYGGFLGLPENKRAAPVNSGTRRARRLGISRVPYCQGGFSSTALPTAYDHSDGRVRFDLPEDLLAMLLRRGIAFEVAS